MSTVADVSLIEKAEGATPFARQAAFKAELRSWALMGASSLAIAGIFALLLAVSRIPGIEHIFGWTLTFFPKGLVIHVVFSLVIWFLIVFGLLASFAAEDVSGGNIKFAGLGRTGLALVAMSFPMLFLPAFDATTQATLNNYIPVIVHPLYYVGLMFLGAGILMPVLRLFANVFAARGPKTPLVTAMTAGGIVYTVALVCFVLGVRQVWGEEPSRLMHERMFWGGGHVLQFLYCLLMLSGWYILAKETLGEDIVDPEIFTLATRLIAVFAVPAIIFYFAFEPFSFKQTEAFRRLQFVLSLPSLMIAVGGLTAVLKTAKTRALPWTSPAFLALTLSPLVFGAGGIMGLLITGSDTRTPAHYHGVIAAVNLACMGLMLAFCLPRLQRAVDLTKRSARLQIVLFGCGQFMASIGLYLAGGYGAPRKTPGAAGALVDGAVAGLYLHGFGALFAVMGGVMFVFAMLRALLGRRNGPEATVI